MQFETLHKVRCSNHKRLELINLLDVRGIPTEAVQNVFKLSNGNVRVSDGNAGYHIEKGDGDLRVLIEDERADLGGGKGEQSQVDRCGEVLLKL